MTSELSESCSPSWGLMSSHPSPPENQKRRTRKPQQTFRRGNCDVDDVVSEVFDYDHIQSFLTPQEQERSLEQTACYINPPTLNPYLGKNQVDQRINNNPNRHLSKSVVEQIPENFEESNGMRWNGIKSKNIQERFNDSSHDKDADLQLLKHDASESEGSSKLSIVTDVELITHSSAGLSGEISGNHVSNRLDRQCKMSCTLQSNDLDDSDESFNIGPEDDADGNYEDDDWISSADNSCRTKNKLIGGTETVSSDAPVNTGLHGNLFSCKLCEFQFTSRSKLKTHMKKHAIRTISCSECQIFFTSQGALLWHARFVHTARKYDHECEVCGVTVRLKQDLMSHYMTHRLAKGVARCPDCSQSFKNTVLLKLHQLSMCTKIPEVNTGSVASTVRNDILPSVNNDSAERDITTNLYTSSVKGIDATNDDVNLDDAGGVTSSSMAATPSLEEVVTFFCRYCPATFHSKGMYTIHTKKHTKPHACDICGRGFAKNFTLLCHRKTHLNQKDFRCELCGQAFTLRPQLTKHLSDNHAPEHKLVCHQCNARFKHSSMLRRHESYYCGFHAANAVDMSSSDDHTLTSSGTASVGIPSAVDDKEHPCPHCDKVLDCVWALEQHVKYHSRKFSCHLCGNKFGERFHLQSHLLTHLGVRPFRCTVCGMQFPMKAHCKRHCLMHTRQQTYECSTCGFMFRQEGERRTHTRERLCIGRRHEKHDLRLMVAFDKPDLESLGITSSMLGYVLSPSEQAQPPPPPDTACSDPLTCDVSSASVHSSPPVTEHIKTEIDDGTVVEGDTAGAPKQVYPCTLCTKKCSKRAHLVVHMARSHSVGAAPFRCCVCGHDAAFERTMRLHLESHIPYRRFSCRVCNARFSNERGLSAHTVGEKCGRRKPSFEAYDAESENIVIEYVTEDLSAYNQVAISLSAIKSEREGSVAALHATSSADDVINHSDPNQAEIKTEVDDDAEYNKNDYYDNFVGDSNDNQSEKEEEDEEEEEQEEDEDEATDDHTICDSDADRSDAEIGVTVDQNKLEPELNDECGLDLSIHNRSSTNAANVVAPVTDRKTNNVVKETYVNSTADNSFSGGRLVFRIKKKKVPTATLR